MWWEHLDITPSYAAEIAYERGWSKELEDYIIASKDAHAMRMLAGVPGANVPRLERAVIKSGQPEEIFNFIIDVSGANVNRLLNALAPYPEWIREYDRYEQDKIKIASKFERMMAKRKQYLASLGEIRKQIRSALEP